MSTSVSDTTGSSEDPPLPRRSGELVAPTGLSSTTGLPAPPGVSAPPGLPPTPDHAGPQEHAGPEDHAGPGEHATPAGQGATPSGLQRWGVWLGLAAVVAWGCWNWRAELDGVPYLDDSSVHAQMVRAAVTRFQGGHLPLTSWWPYLGLGSPQFLHYQALPSMLTAVLGLGTGGDAAFRISLYLLLALWPLVLYASARLFGFGRGTSLLAAAASPFLASAPGVGYEPKAYVWIGYGVWAQLWASWALPLAWAATWRAMTSRRAVPLGVFFVALTMALHFETGYLALLAVALLPFFAPGPWRRRLGTAVVVGGGAFLVSAWVTVPLLMQGHWAATNEILRNTPLVNGYGAKQIMAWLFQGQIFDAHRLPVVTILAAVGLVVCLRRWRSAGPERAVVALFVMSLLLSFGRTTFGSLTVLLPGSSDIFMRRFTMGTQLAGLYMAAVGGAALAAALGRVAARGLPGAAAWAGRGGGRLVPVGLAGLLGIAVLAPAWTQFGTYARANAADVAVQRSYDRGEGAQVDQLLAYVRAHRGGRVYAGMPSNWGSVFRVGYVPVFKYVESRDVEEVGYTLRTASLMTDPEFYFDENDPGDYALFGVRYMLLPDGHPPPVPAKLAMRRGPYLLWVLPGRGLVRVVDTVGVLSVDRTNVGIMSVPYLESGLPGEGRYLAVSYAGAAPAALTDSEGGTIGVAGTVRSEHDDLPNGRATATVVAHRQAAVVLSASFDPGWTARVDGRAAPVIMLAPALPAVRVGPGVHTVTFTYGGFGLYPELFVVALLAMAVVVSAYLPRRSARWPAILRRGAPLRS